MTCYIHLPFYLLYFSNLDESLDLLSGFSEVHRLPKTYISFLADNFRASEICTDAKETCYNWFCKIASVRELLPRM